jgi:hypothetical protein
MAVLVGACLVVAIAAVAYAAGRTKSPPTAVVRATRFELVDGEGKVWAALGFEGGTKSASRQVGLRLFDKTGAARARLALAGQDGSPELELQTGQAGLIVHLREGNEPMLVLRDARGRTGLVLLASDIGSSLLLPDSDGEARAGLGAFRDGSAGLVLHSSETKASAELDLSSDGVPRLELKNKDGEVCGQVGPPAGDASH